MSRTAKLQLTVGLPEYTEACLLCAKIAWLSNRLRQFHKHIAKEEQILYSVWRKRNPRIMQDYIMCQRDASRWDNRSPRITRELDHRKRQLKTRLSHWHTNKSRVENWLLKRKHPEQPVSDKITRLELRVKRYETLLKQAASRTRQFKNDLLEYPRIMKKESAKYIKKNFSLPIHLEWDRKLNKVLAHWESSHSVCTICGLRFGGFHVGQPSDIGGNLICQFCLKDREEDNGHRELANSISRHSSY